MRKEHLSPAIYHFYKNPIMIVEGKGQYLFDETGRRYLDGIGGIVTVSVGHCHPEVTAASNAQNETIVHTTTLYLNPQVALFAKELAAKMPGDLKVCYFVNSGSEASDLAIMMARAATGNYDVIALRNAYHGGSPGAMALTSHHTWKFNVPHSFGVQHALMPDLYRGIYGADDANAGSKYAADVKSLIQYGTSGQVAAFIAETIQGVGGAVVTKCNQDSVVLERISGDSKLKASFLTLSRWPRASATAVLLRPSSPRQQLQSRLRIEFTSTHSAEIQFRARKVVRCCESLNKKNCKRIHSKLAHN